MALYKKEVVVRSNSSADFTAAMNWTKDWLMNSFQDKADNKDEDGNYIDYFFADVFFSPGHANGGQVWRIFSPPCEQKFSMVPAPSGRIEFKINDLAAVENALEVLESWINDHEERIAALEEAGSETEATVI
jgi:hypothetical protein